MQKSISNIDELEAVAGFFKTMADTTRLKILYSLSKQELCVKDLTIILGASSSLISHQLRLLKSYRIVKQRRIGKNVYYSLDDEHVASVLNTVSSHVNHKE